MGILLFELFRNPLFMGILNKWETLVTKNIANYQISKHLYFVELTLY